MDQMIKEIDANDASIVEKTFTENYKAKSALWS
jgi:hypothetical protein